MVGTVGARTALQWLSWLYETGTHFPDQDWKTQPCEGKLCLIRERNEEQRKAVQELAEPFKDLLVPGG